MQTSCMYIGKLTMYLLFKLIYLLFLINYLIYHLVFSSQIPLFGIFSVFMIMEYDGILYLKTLQTDVVCIDPFLKNFLCIYWTINGYMLKSKLKLINIESLWSLGALFYETDIINLVFRIMFKYSQLWQYGSRHIILLITSVVVMKYQIAGTSSSSR